MTGGYLGLGSNVGERLDHLLAALDGLEARGVEVRARSSVYETEPVGEILDQPDFLNAAIRIATERSPLALLDACKEVEVEQGRRLGARRHSPRPLDIDLLLIDGVETAGERLVLPHPEVAARRFVLVPLLELDPGLRLPDGSRLADALERLGDGERVTRVGALARG